MLNRVSLLCVYPTNNALLINFRFMSSNARLFFVNKQLSIQTGVKLARMCTVHIPTEPILHAAVGGWVGVYVCRQGDATNECCLFSHQKKHTLELCQVYKVLLGSVKGGEKKSTKTLCLITKKKAPSADNSKESKFWKT